MVILNPENILNRKIVEPLSEVPAATNVSESMQNAISEIEKTKDAKAQKVKSYIVGNLIITKFSALDRNGNKYFYFQISKKYQTPEGIKFSKKFFLEDLFILKDFIEVNKLALSEEK